MPVWIGAGEHGRAHPLIGAKSVARGEMNLQTDGEVGRFEGGTGGVGSGKHHRDAKKRRFERIVEICTKGKSPAFRAAREMGTRSPWLLSKNECFSVSGITIKKKCS